jgi:peptidyl-prolyl cis-trans isomerase A (cyclophilin A)
MKFKYLFFIFVNASLLLGCKNSKKSEQIKSFSKSIKDVVSTNEIKKFPLLTDDNAMSFLIEYGQTNIEDKVKLETTFGDIVIKLYHETPYHRANFIYLTKRNYFADTQFYRVVKDFVIQGGNSDDNEVYKKRSQIGRYLLPNDFRANIKHKRGVISMPSSDINNPHKLASPFQFFIVQRHKDVSFLDGNYTAFGEVIEGMNIVDSICAQPTDKNEWPLENIFINNSLIVK